MAKFVPVIVADGPAALSSGRLLETIQAAAHPALYHEPVVMTQRSMLKATMAAAGSFSSRATFVAVPDGSGRAIMAAAGCVVADIDCPDAPILLMQAETDRSDFPDFDREVSRAANDVADGSIVVFTCGSGSAERPTGDYAMSYDTARREFMELAPGIMSYAAGAVAKASSDRNVIELDGTLLFFRDPGSFGEVVAFLSEAARPMRHRTGPLKDTYSPWAAPHSSHEGFYGPQFAAAPAR